MMTWTQRLIGQLDFYWEAHLAPRLVGLTDEEYFWEPAPPVTTIAWRMTHLSVEVWESRYRAFFGGEGPTMFAPGERILAAGELPADAEAAVGYLTGAYQRWRDAVAGLSDAELLAPLGSKGADFAEFPMVELVLHLNREAMHHGGEICLLRDLYRTRRHHPATPPSHAGRGAG